MMRFLDRSSVSPYAHSYRAGASLDGAIERPARLAHYTGASDLAVLAASLLVAVTRAHALVDGNKRASICLCDEFLALNDHHLEGSTDELARLGWDAPGLSEEEVVERIRPLVAPGPPSASFGDRHPAVMSNLAT
jgi:prophage maintenance system killer protein